MTGSLAPPPPYGSEQGSILLEAGRDGGGNQATQSSYPSVRHSRSRSGQPRSAPPTSPGPIRSPTEISLAQLAHIPSSEDVGEGTSHDAPGAGMVNTLDFAGQPPPEYTSPEGSILTRSRRSSGDNEREVERPLLRSAIPRPEVPSYDVAVGNDDPQRRRRERADEYEDAIWRLSEMFFHDSGACSGSWTNALGRGMLWNFSGGWLEFYVIVWRRRGWWGWAGARRCKKAHCIGEA